MEVHYGDRMMAAADNLSDQKSHIYCLVLSSAGIEYELVRTGFGSQIRVKQSDVEKAVCSINAYLEENPDPAKNDKNAGFDYRGSYAGIWAALFLLVWHVAIVSGNDLNRFIPVFGASADKIINGELYRCVTAMLLHADALHLAGNMAAIAIFGSAVCSIAGWGVGWLMILFTGIAGNFINAVCYQTAHISIGSSTAVFGCIGLLCAHQVFKKMSVPGRRFSAVIPVAAGLALLGLMSSGSRVDITAHLFGFSAGLVFGSGWSLFVKRMPSTGYQCISLLSGILIIMISWLRALWS